jgi:hypothetical protein
MNNKTEDRINDFIVSGLKLYHKFNAEGKKDLANKVLVFTTELSDLLLKLSSVGNSEVHCGCGRKLTDPYEIEFFNNEGECAGCEHVRSDLRFEPREEAENDD